MSVLIVGSTALDSIKTPKAENPRLLGGSASHAAVAASFFAPVKLVGIVGDDFPKQYLRLYQPPQCGLGRPSNRPRQDLPLVRRIRSQHEQPPDARHRTWRLRDLHAPAARLIPGFVLRAPRQHRALPSSTMFSTRCAAPNSSWPTPWTSGSTSPCRTC